LLLHTEIKSHTFPELWETLPLDERILMDVLRSLIRENLPPFCKEKFSWNVPCYYGKRSICLIWPASVPRGGFKNGVLLGFAQGNKLKDVDHYLTRGTNKKIFYKIYKRVEEIDPDAIAKLLKEAVLLDQTFK